MGLHTIDRFFPGGFLGVDVFFVLSGFLITSLILEELDQRDGEYSFRAFYWRRAFRLGPALVLWLTLVAAPTAVALHQAGQIPIATAASLFYVGDFAVAAGVNLGTAYTHVWSLAIEEQFYVVWPFILVWSVRRTTTERLRRLLIGAVIVSVVVAETTSHAFDANYFLPTGHLVPIVLGCFAGHLFMRGGAVRLETFLRRELVGVCSLAVLALVVVGYRPLNPELALLVLIAVAVSTAALLLHLCLREDGLSGRLLSTRPALWLGRRSYGLYLYHRTLAVLVPALIPGIKLRVAGPLVLLLSFAIAELSFRLVERPVNRAGRNWLRKKERAPIKAAEFLLPITPHQVPTAIERDPPPATDSSARGEKRHPTS